VISKAVTSYRAVIEYQHSPPVAYMITSKESVAFPSDTVNLTIKPPSTSGVKEACSENRPVISLFVREESVGILSNDHS